MTSLWQQYVGVRKALDLDPLPLWCICTPKWYTYVISCDICHSVGVSDVVINLKLRDIGASEALAPISASLSVDNLILSLFCGATQIRSTPAGIVLSVIRAARDRLVIHVLIQDCSMTLPSIARVHEPLVIKDRAPIQTMIPGRICSIFQLSRCSLIISLYRYR